MAVAATDADERPEDGYRWEIDGRTLAAVKDKLDTNAGTTFRRDAGGMRVALTKTDSPSIQVPAGIGTGQKARVLPGVTENVLAIGNFFQVPSAFLRREDPAVQEFVLNHHLQKASGSDVLLRIADDRLLEVGDPREQKIDPRAIVEAAGRAVTDQATVTSFDLSNTSLHCDLIVPEGFDRGWGGDKATTRRKVGDITRGGIRFGQNRKQNTAPWVQPWLFRLICTNGMETFDPSLKLDARGKGVEETLAEFEALCERAFSRVEGDIKAFYDLRSEAVAHPEQAILRMGDENKGIPQSVIVEVVRAVPSLGEDVTMFDVVNLVTNQANDPALLQFGTRRALQRAGGVTISNHSHRCATCQHALHSMN